MQHFIRISWLVFAIVIFLLIPGAEAGEKVRLANGEWPPFTSEKLKHYGVYSHIVTEAFALEGLKVEYQFFPWARSYHNVKEGTWDGSLTWAQTPEKKKYVFFSDPVLLHKKVIFHLKPFKFNWRKIDDLKGLRIGAIRGYTYGEEFDQAAKSGSLHVEYTTNEMQNLKKLMTHRIQIFPSDIDVGYDLIRTRFTPEEAGLFTHHEKPIQKAYTCVIFTKKNPEKSRELLAIFNRGLKKLKESGLYAKLMEASERGEYKKLKIIP